MKERFNEIMDRWFLSEPPLFQVICTHSLVPNANMACPLRCGMRRIEYNPDYVKEMSDDGLEEALKTEAIRILLKHPYERKPDGCCQEAMAIGSNLVIGDNYDHAAFRIEKPADFGLPGGQAYEWYSRRIQEMMPESSEQNRDLSELWDEDEMAVIMINGVIEGCKSWGSLAGKLAEQLQASTRATINWRSVLSGFRASILSSGRKLTRMRPNRRTGFQNMGSIRRFNTRLLVAVDVSGSISSESLSYFYGVVNSAFRYGFESVDVIQFDCGVRVVQNLKKVIKDPVVVGRGGTSFQEPIDYAAKNGYDGLLILTDGYAPQPVIPDNMGCKIIWVCQDRACYEQHHEWMEKSGRVCSIELK